MLRLEVAGLVAPHEVLERAEEDERSIGIDGCRVATRLARQILPPVEVDVGLQVSVPRIFDGRLEGHDQDAIRTHPPLLHALGELIGGERLAESHLRVPEELGDRVRVFGPSTREVLERLLDSGCLLVAHPERRVVRALVSLAGAQLGDGSVHVVGGAAHPFCGRLEDDVLEPLLDQPTPHLGIGDQRSILSLCRLVDFEHVVDSRLALRLLDARVDVLTGLTDLEAATPAPRNFAGRPRVQAGVRLGLGGEEVGVGPRHWASA